MRCEVGGGICCKRCRGRTPGRPEGIIGLAIYMFCNNLIAGRRGRRPLHRNEIVFRCMQLIFSGRHRACPYKPKNKFSHTNSNLFFNFLLNFLILVLLFLLIVNFLYLYFPMLFLFLVLYNLILVMLLLLHLFLLHLILIILLLLFLLLLLLFLIYP